MTFIDLNEGDIVRFIKSGDVGIVRQSSFTFYSIFAGNPGNYRFVTIRNDRVDGILEIVERNQHYDRWLVKWIENWEKYQ